MFFEVLFFLGLLMFLNYVPGYLYSLFFLEVLFFPVLWGMFVFYCAFSIFWGLLIIITSGVVGLCLIVLSLSSFNQEVQVSFLE